MGDGRQIFTNLESRPPENVSVEAPGPSESSGVGGGKKRLKKFETVWQQTGSSPRGPQELDIIPSYSGYIAAAIWHG